MNVYEGIMQGLEEAIAHSEGEVKARTKTFYVAPIPEYGAADIKKIRGILGMTQVIFAGFMGVSPKTVEAWEAGRNMPDGPARRMLAMLESDPELPKKMNVVRY